MDNRVLPIVITFNPDLPLLQDNINHLLQGCYEVLIWDNTPGGCDQIVSNLSPLDKIIIISPKNNLGISKAINKAVNVAIEKGYEYILTMDQDSILCNISEFLDTSISQQNTCSCIIGPFVIHKCLTDSYYTKSQTITEVDDIITSGAIIPIAVFKEIGGFNELFFVDAIDIEFCIRAKKHGYNIFVNSTGQLIQTFGNPNVKKFFGHKFISSNYSPFRLYGIFRNHILTGRLHGWDSHIRKTIYGYLRSFIPKIIMFESNKNHKIMAIIKGIYDGFTVRLK